MTAEFRRLAALLLLAIAMPGTAQAVGSKDFCPIYPIALPQQVLDGKQAGDVIAQLPRGTSAGNFGWLSWAGATDAPTLAQSLIPPGDSDTYVSPDGDDDRRLDIGDWAQGATGSMNATSVRDRLDALKTQDIILPVWDRVRGKGALVSYRVQRFVSVRLTDYQLTGQGWLSFEYRGDAICYNQPPTALPQTLATDEDAPLPLTLAGRDPDDDALSFRVVTGPLHGRLEDSAPDLVYHPNADYHGEDSFQFIVNDGQYDSEPVTVQLTVRPVNDAPVADAQAVVTDEDMPLPIPLTGGDIDGDTLSFTVVQPPQHGSLSGEGGALVYTPAPDFHGEDELLVVANDGQLDSAPVRIVITVMPVNDTPVAEAQSLSTPEDTALTLTLSGSDVDGGSLDFRVVAPPSHGSLSGEAPNLTYTPNPGYFGDDAFEFVAYDGQLDSESAQIAIAVIEANRAPQIVSTPPVSVNEGETYRYDVDAVDVNVGDVLAYGSEQSPTGALIQAESGELAWLADQQLMQSVRGDNLACRMPAQIGAFDPVVKWHWTRPNGSAADENVFGPVMVGQLTDDNADGRIDADDIPDAVFVSQQPTATSRTTLNVVSGSDGLVKRQLVDSKLSAYGSLALADLDDDGVVEIVGVAMGSPTQLVAYRHDLTVLWRAQTETRAKWPEGMMDAVAIADLDGDGSPEVIHGRRAYSASGELLWQGTGDGGGQSSYGYVPVIADIAGDGSLEVIAGRTAYRHDGSILWHATSVPADGFAAIGDFEGDGAPEIVLVANGVVYLLDGNGNVRWSRAIPGGGVGGPPTIADLDADGMPEIGVAGLANYLVLDGDGSIKWQQPSQDKSSNRTGSSVFDFDSDGRAEVVYADEVNLYVYDGDTGAIRMRVPVGSGTTLEYPVIVDLDGNGSAEIVVGSNHWPDARYGVTVLGSASNSWAATRSVWNQHAYHIDNINDDGTVPRVPAKSWLTHNAFRLNTFPDRHPLGLADLALFDLRLDESDGTAVKLLVVNRGLAPTAAPTSLSIFNGDPDTGGVLLGTLQVPALAAGEELTLSLTGIAADAVNTDLHARTDEAGDIAECLDDNNRTAAAYFEVRATDPEGLYDSQRFTVTVEAVNRAPVIRTDSLPAARAGRDYRFHIDAQDPNRGDALRFELIDAPAGLQIEAVSGELRWNPLDSQVGTHTVAVRVTDLGGLAVQRSFDLQVTANYPPKIVSEPVMEATVGRQYRYEVIATDEDGDSLQFSLVEAPSGMTIDAETGVIVWLPSADQRGELTVSVDVEDGMGGTDSQAYVIRAVGGESNRPPLIVSRAPARVGEGDIYRYEVMAEDPDGDSLVYQVDSDDARASIGPLSGIFESPDLGVVPDASSNNDPWCGLPAASLGSYGDVLRYFLRVPPSSAQIRLGGLHANTSYRLLSLPTRQVLAEGILQAGEVKTLGVSGSKLVLETGAPVQAIVSQRDNGTYPGIGSHYYHAVDGHSFVGRRFFLPGTRVDRYTEPVVMSVERTSVRILSASGTLLESSPPMEPRAVWRPTALKANGSYYVESEGDVVVLNNRANGNTRVPPIDTASCSGDTCLDDAGQNFLLGTHGWGGGAVTVFNPGKTAVTISLRDISTGMTVVSGAQVEAGAFFYQTKLGTAYYELLAEGGEVTVWSGDNECGASPAHMGDDVTINLGKEGKSFLIHSQTDGATVFAGISPTSVRINGGAPTLLMAGESIDIEPNRLVTIVADQPVTVQTIGGNGCYFFNDWSETLRPAPDGAWRGLGDLVVNEVTLVDGGVVSARVKNRGTRATGEGAVLAFESEASSRKVYLGEVDVPALGVGEEAVLTVPVTASPSGASKLIARVLTDEAAIEECHVNNNYAESALFSVSVADPLGLSDSQQFTVSVESATRAPVFETDPVTTAVAGGRYIYRPAVSDEDRGDSHRFALVAKPEGANIDPVTGIVVWTPSGVAGSYAFTLRATDSHGLSVEQSFSVQVFPSGNTAPYFVTDPITQTSESMPYQYVARADDAEADVLTYWLAIHPGGMEIDSDTGAISWTPTSDGQFPVVIRASDGRGGVGEQRFTLSVAPVSNRAPVITTTPATAVTAGALYYYPLDATDSDGDIMSVYLRQAPAGMSLNEWTAEIRWTPTSAQVGEHAVLVEVEDGRGGSDTQAFTIVVSAPVGNQTPIISSTPAFTGKVGREYRYAVEASDGNGDTLQYSLSEAPTGMAIDAASGVLTWLPEASGRVFATVRVSDGRAYVEQRWSIDVAAASQRLDAIVRVEPNPVGAGEEYTVTVQVTGASGPVTITATLDGEPITLVEGSNTRTAPDVEGPHLIHVSLTDGFETVAGDIYFTVGDALDSTPPEVKLVLPAMHPDHDSVEVTAPTSVTGYVSGSDVTQWLLAVRETGSSAQRILAQGQGEFSERVIAQFDPTLLENGQYHLILQAQDSSGNVATDYRIVRVDGDMKIGHFSITFEDATVPLVGLPVTVTRTYDSRTAGQSRDFGYGWTVGYRTVRLQESRRPGFSWDVYESGTLTSGQRCFLPNGDPIVTVRMPDGELLSFKAKASPECQSLFDGNDQVRLVFEALDGQGYTLEQLDYGNLVIRAVAGEPGAHLTEYGEEFGQPVDPQHYRLTTPEGLVYAIDQSVGIQKIDDPASGASLTFTHLGVKHSSGVGIDFIRDAAGRITQMKLPDGNVIEYGYTAQGDLDIVLDTAKEITSFAYASQRPHYLQDIIDPRGVRLARNEYDDDGRLVAIIDADGHRTEYEHAISDRIERIKDRNGHSTTYVYDEAGRVTHETNALGETTVRSYDADGNTLTQTDALGRTTTWTYDARGNRLTETNHAGETTTSSYNRKNQLLTQQDAAGRTVVSNAYDWRLEQLLVSSTDANDATTSFTYVGGVGSGGTGQLQAITDASGAATRFDYDVRGNKASETDALGNVTSFAYDAMGRVTRETRRRTVDGQIEELVTAFRYDAKGRLLETTHPDGSTTTAEYAGLDQPVKECDALNRCSSTEFDARGHVARIVHPDGSSQSKQYDGNGNVVAETDSNGHTTRFVYDAANRLTETIHPDGTRSRNVYDKAGQLVESIDENGHGTRYGYDEAGRRVRVVQPDPDSGVAGAGPVTLSEYDANGRRVAVNDANGHTQRFVYDGNGRQIETIHADDTPSDDSDNDRTRIVLDGAGQKVAEIDEAGRTTRFVYDPLGRLLRVVQPNPETGANPPLVEGESPDAGTLVTRYGYDESGNRVEQIDAEGRATRWEFDSLGREVARVLPEGQREERRYDAAGQLLARIDFNGDTTQYFYDPAGRIERIEYADGRVDRYRYDAVGRRIAAMAPEGDWSWTYDSRGRVLSEAQADGSVLRYGYDAAGNRVRLDAEMGAESMRVDYTFDALRRLIGATDATGTTVFDYDAAGNRVALEYPNGVLMRYRYDSRNRLVDLEARDGSGSLLRFHGYALHPTGRRMAASEIDSDGSERDTDYRFDGGYRLVGETQRLNGVVDFEASYGYDRVGNRTYSVIDGIHTAYTYDGNDRLLQEGGARYQYDDNGNTLRIVEGSDVTENAYDARGKLTRSTSSSGGVETVTTYAYDPDGHRIRRQVGAQATSYVVDRQHEHAEVIAERNANSGAIDVRYLHADELLSQRRDGVSYYLADGHGSTRALVDGSGAVTDRYRYDGFGVLLDRQGDTANDYLYTGEQWDSALGAYYLRARYYDPSAGRFTQMDSWMGSNFDPVTLHKYLYANADPVNGHDPSGMFTMMEVNVTTNIRATLGNMQAEAGFNMMDVLMNGGKFDGAGYLGGAMFLSTVARVAPKMMGMFLRRCRNSFVEGTLVNTERGRIAIEDVEIGDRVWSFNEVTGEESWNQVLHLIEGEQDYTLVTITTEGGESFTATEGHPLYTADGRWMDAREVKAGDRLVLEGGVEAAVESVAVEARRAKVWNLSVENAETYFVGEDGVLAHNISCKVPKLGGSYRELKRAHSGAGNTGVIEVNHIPPKSVSGVSKSGGPAIVMLKDDHRKLLSTSDASHRAEQARLIREGKFDEAFELDVADIQDQFPGKYDQAIEQARLYCREKGWCKR